MSEQNQAGSANQSHTKNRPKTKKPIVMDRQPESAQPGLVQQPPKPLNLDVTGSQPAPSTMLYGPHGLFSSGSSANQAARLQDPRLQTAQRQAMAVEMGRAQGNQHLKEVVASIRSEEKKAASIKKSTHRPQSVVAKKTDSPEITGPESYEEDWGGMGPPSIAVGEPPPPKGQNDGVKDQRSEPPAGQAEKEGRQGVEAVLSIQPSYNNSYVPQMMPLIQKETQHQTVSSAEIQRQDDDPAQVIATTAQWNPPLDLAVARTCGEAALRLLVIEQRLKDLKSSMGDLPASDVENALKPLPGLREELTREGDLTTDDVNRLKIVSIFIKSAYEDGVKAMADALVQGLGKIKGSPDTSAVEEMLAEELHYAFIDEGDNEVIAELKTALSTIDTYKGKADKVADWATKVATKVKATKATKFLAAYGKGSEQIGKGLKLFGQVLDAAKVIDGLFSDRAPGGVGSDLNNFKNVIDGIDLGMTFVKAVPLFGTLWSSYYGPLTKAIIGHLEVIKKAEDRQVRDLETWVQTAMGGERTASGAPKLPNNPEILKHFPGGQPVLDFMYALVNGGSPSLSPGIEQFFIAYRERFNAGHEEGNQIEVESHSTWYNPWTWLDEDTSPNLIAWLRSNQDIVWAQLYGSIPKTF